jgi:choice-of-anchor B domain-containing protein
MLIIIITSTGFAQYQNVRLVSNLNDYPDQGYTDCWGYTAPNGDEYALLGVNGGVSIVSLLDTSNISEVEFVPWVEFEWYDIKIYKNYMYVSSEGSRDILIVDLSNLPISASIVGTYSGTSSEPHNIYIDTTAAVLYIVEDFNWDPSVRLVSLTDPENPTQLSTINTGINGMDVHDVWAQDGLLYISEGLDPSIGIFDVSDPSNPFLKTRVNIPAGGYSHQVSVTEDNLYMVTTEETPNKTVKLWDIQDLDNIGLIDDYLGENQLAHNAYFSDGFIYIAHYESGLKVLDYSDPLNLIEVGFYDTYPQNDGHVFRGVWGTYPFFKSGLILVSDRSTGLYIVDFEREQGPQIVTNDLKFGNILVNSGSDTLTAVIRNYGTEDLIVTAISDPPEPFSLIDLPGLPVNVPVNESIDFGVVFSPTIERIENTSIIISSNDENDPDADLSLSGTGLVLNPAEAGVMYASIGRLEDDSGSLITIDPLTGNGTLKGSMGLTNAPGLAINSKGEIYCTSSFPADLYRIDSKTGGAVLASPIDLPFLDAIAFDGHDNLYALGGDPPLATLYRIDIETGEITTIGSTEEFLRGMAFDPVTGFLWASSGASRDELFTVDIETAKATFIGTTDLGGSTPDIQFDNKGELFGSKGGGQKNNNLISISKVDGKGVEIGSIGYKAVSGLSTRLDTFWYVMPEKVITNKKYYTPGADTLKIQCNMWNPNGHALTVGALIEGYNQSIIDTVWLYDDGAHDDSSTGDNIFGGSWPVISGHGYFNVSILAYPTETGYLNNFLHSAAQFTTAGPVVFDSFTITSEDTIPNAGDLQLVFNITLKNESLTDTVVNIKTKITSLDTCAVVRGFDRKYNDIAPGEIAEPNQGLVFSFDPACSYPAEVQFAIDILSDGFLFWSDTFTVFVDSTVSAITNTIPGIPLTYSLEKNFPNPFNPSTTIGYQLPFVSDVNLSIYNLLGQKVATLVSKQQPVGYFQVNWDASGYASGVYYYRIEANPIHSKQEKPFIQTKKLILVR